MTTTGQLDLGAAQIVDRSTGELIGYVFTVPSGKGQLQRWLLHRAPNNEFEVQPPPASMASWSLADWQANAPALWRANGYYVWAQADLYHHEGTYDGFTWTSVPPASSLPAPSFPERPGSNYQLDYTGGKVIDVLQQDWRGRAYVVRGLAEASSIEYWFMPGQYQPAGKARAATISVGNDPVGSLDGFVGLVNQSWAAGCSFAITGCINYHGEAAPFAP
jgi:hypothetical protein